MLGIYGAKGITNTLNYHTSASSLLIEYFLKVGLVAQSPAMFTLGLESLESGRDTGLRYQSHNGHMPPYPSQASVVTFLPDAVAKMSVLRTLPSHTSYFLSCFATLFRSIHHVCRAAPLVHQALDCHQKNQSVLK